MDIARAALNPSLRAASCCSVDVVNGALRAFGHRLASRRSPRRNGTSARPAAERADRASSSSTTSESAASWPVAASKSLPRAAARRRSPAWPGNRLPGRRPDRRLLRRRQPGRASSVSWARKVPDRSQYDALRNAMRARSRSTTSRAATLWTRPAETGAPGPAAGDERHLVPEEPVEDPATLLGLHELHVELAPVARSPPRSPAG